MSICCKWYQLACHNGHIECFKKFDDEIDEVEAMHIVCVHGYIKFVKYLVSQNYPKTKDAIESACKSGNFKLIKFLCKHRFPRSELAMYNASLYNDNLKILKYLISENFPKDLYVINNAAKFSNLKSVKYLFTIGYNNYINDKLELINKDSVYKLKLKPIIKYLKTQFLLNLF
jgi:hypothetical protein